MPTQYTVCVLVCPIIIMWSPNCFYVPIQFIITVGYATTSVAALIESYNDQFLSVKLRCYNESGISLHVKVWHVWPQSTEQAFRRVDHHWQNTTSLSQFVATVSTADLVNAPHQDTTRLLRWNTSEQVSFPTGSPLAKHRHQNIFISNSCICGVLIGCGRSENQNGAGVTDEVHICAKQPRVFLHMNPKCTSIISPTLHSTFSLSVTKCRSKI